jgi:hypothetical protein
MLIAAIDRHSGYVWGVSSASTRLWAAAEILHDADTSRSYAPAEEATEGTYALAECDAHALEALLDLYHIPDTLEVLDGQDPATIAAVEACPYLGTVCHEGRV